MLTQVAVTQGVMYYQAPNSIRWEYGAPSNLQFVLFGGKMTTKKDGKINAVPNKMAKEMAQIIANLINGGALANEKEFKIQYFTHQNDIWVVLTPKNAMLRQMYDKFELQLSDNQYVAKKIIMYEVGGDKTTTTFKNHKVNQPLPKDLFTLKP